MERQAEHRGRSWFEVVEELVLEAIEDADEEIFAFDRLARVVIEGDYHCGFVGGRSSPGGDCLRFVFRHWASLGEAVSSDGPGVQHRDDPLKLVGVLNSALTVSNSFCCLQVLTF